MTLLSGQVAVVTGGRRGIGKTIAEAFQQAGAKVAVIAASQAGPGDLYVSCDLGDRAARGGVIRHIYERFGRVDILVNNAGVQLYGPALTFPLADWDAQIELMLTAPLDLAQQAAAYMIEARCGRVINISSIAGVNGTRNTIGYSAAKAGLIEMTKCLSNEWLPHGITVNAIAPGFIETDMLAPLMSNEQHSAAIQGRIPAGRFGLAGEVAAAALWLASDAARYVSGVCLPVDGGFLAR